MRQCDKINKRKCILQIILAIILVCRWLKGDRPTSTILNAVLNNDIFPNGIWLVFYGKSKIERFIR